jgi:competence protein ComEC
MSFAAVVSLIAAYETARSQSSERELAGWLRPVAFFLGGIVLSTVIASLAVAPIGAYHFHRSQQYALLANLISVPICNLIVMPAALLTLVMMPFGLEALPLAIMAKGIDVMSATAHWVASLPGAVMHIPKISDMSFALMIAGGLWLTLWQTRWRMFGLAAIGAGLVVAGDDPRPDVLAGRGGELVALRSSDGTLAAMGSRSGSFELTRWLEHDGDARAPRDVMRGTAFRCDGVGCIAGVRGLTLAVERHPSAAAEDCKKADIVIGGSERSRGCAHPRLVLDRATLRRDGTHAIYLATAQGSEKPAIEKVETVASRRGERPWTERPLRPRRAPAPDTPPENTMGRSPSSDQPTEEMPLDDERD